MPRRKAAPRLYLDRTRRQWVIRDGQSFIRTGCTEAELTAAERHLAFYIGKKHKPEPGINPLIVDMLLAYSTEHLPGLAGESNTRYNIANLESWWGDKKLADVTAKNCRAYALTRQRGGARRDLEVLRASINYWHRNYGPLPSVPAVTLPAKGPPRDRWLTREEAKRLRKAAMKWPHIYRLVVLGLRTGSRPGAILQLRWDWIDLDRRVMRRRAPGEAQDSRKRKPPVRINAALCRLLRRWKAHDGSKCEWVVHYNGKPVTRIKRAWNLVKAAARLPDVTPHTLRHTRATWLMQGGIDRWEAAGHLGMTVETLERVYGHHHPDFQGGAPDV